MLQYCEVRVRYYVVNHDGHRAYTSFGGSVCVGGVLDRKVPFGGIVVGPEKGRLEKNNPAG